MAKTAIDLKENYPTLLQKGSKMIVKIRNARLAFPALFQPKAFNGEGKPAFSASLILDPKHPAVKEIEAAINEVAKAKWANKADAILKQLKATDKLCLHDGDTKAQYDGFPGNLYVSARNPAKPLVVDADKTELAEADGRPYAGCYVHASIELWAQDNGYGKRVNATLRGVRFYKDGDAFAGGAPASEDEFDEFDDEGAEEALV